MKVLGLSFGRVMKNCDILTKKALIAASEQGAQVAFMNVMNKRIDHCKGCGACSTLMKRGGDIKCILQDDYTEVEQAILDADALIIAAPVYSLGMTGQYKNMLDRFCAAHDRVSLLTENKKRKAEGTPELDKRYFKDRYVCYISVGGASTPNWVSFGLPMMHLFDFSTLMKVVDQIDAYDMGRTGNPMLNKELMQKIDKMGKHLVSAYQKQDASWQGEPGVCPVCHGNLMTLGTSTTIECPICGIQGKISIEKEQIHVTFSEAQQHRARGTITGLQEHNDEIRDMPGVAIPKLEAAKEFLEEEMEKLKQYRPVFE